MTANSYDPNFVGYIKDSSGGGVFLFINKVSYIEWPDEDLEWIMFNLEVVICTYYEEVCDAVI